MDEAKKFKRWITKDVLPSIRKTGRYEYNHKPFKMLTFNIQTEYDLHKKSRELYEKLLSKSIINCNTR